MSLMLLQYNLYFLFCYSTTLSSISYVAKVQPHPLFLILLQPHPLFFICIATSLQPYPLLMNLIYLCCYNLILYSVYCYNLILYFSLLPQPHPLFLMLKRHLLLLYQAVTSSSTLLLFYFLWLQPNPLFLVLLRPLLLSVSTTLSSIPYSL